MLYTEDLKNLEADKYFINNAFVYEKICTNEKIVSDKSYSV